MPCGVGVSTPNEVKEKLSRSCIEVCKTLRGEISGNEIDNENINNVTQNNNSSIIIRADTDMRDNYSPGWKFNHWELKVFVYLFLY